MVRPGAARAPPRNRRHRPFLARSFHTHKQIEPSELGRPFGGQRRNIKFRVLKELAFGGDGGGEAGASWRCTKTILCEKYEPQANAQQQCHRAPKMIDGSSRSVGTNSTH